jgi:tetratricopeptide (TPR) repeat protein
MQVPLLSCVLVVAIGLSACAKKEAPVTTPGAPKFPEFVFPAVSQAASEAMLTRHEQAWHKLQVGDLKNADREFTILLTASADFHPAEAGRGYVALARKDYKAALQHFDRAIAISGAYASAHAGRGQTLLAMNEASRALVSFDAALAADPSLAGIRSVADVLRFKGLQGNVAAAREAAEAGRLSEARDGYLKAIEATPDSPFLYRELSMVERRDGKLDAAWQRASRAVELEPTDARNHVVLADVLEAQGQLQKAADAINAALALEPNEALARRGDALRERAAFDAMPAEYRAIDTAANITRGQLAALLAVQLEDLVSTAPSKSAVVMSDVRGHWAQPWILAVTRAGFMEPFANHAFQPNATVDRGDMATAASRVLNAIVASRPQLGAAWRNARPKFSDLPPGNLRYPAVSLAVAAGVMSATADGSFQPARAVTGAEALAIVQKLQELSRSKRR